MKTIISNKSSKVNKNLTAALAYADKLGWSVFPLIPREKRPLTSNGYKDASTDREKIIEWWTKNPNAGIGVPTGKLNGFFVVDVDDNGFNKTGRETLELLENQYGKLPSTVESISGSGGMHLLFKYVDGMEYKKELGKDIDIKSDGGYIVVSPSIHPNGKSYHWEVSSHPLEKEIVQAPTWLINSIQKKIQLGESYKAKPTSEYVRILQGIGEGERNNALVTLIGHLLARNIDYTEAFEIIHMWNADRVNPPLATDIVTNTFNNILRREAAKRGDNVG